MRTAALLAVALGGCGGAIDEPLGRFQGAIVNGAPDAVHEAVGILIAGHARACSATLIGRQTALTAAHCVDGLSPVELFIDGLQQPSTRAEHVTIHPDYAGGNQADLAVVRLVEPVLELSPLPLARAAPRAREAILLIGHGKADAADRFGTRRQAKNRISTVEPEIFSVLGADSDSGNLCDGDSGGPSLALRDGVEELIGVHSTVLGSCGFEGSDMRVDVFAPWIVRAAEGDATLAAAVDAPLDAVDEQPTPGAGVEQAGGESLAPAVAGPAPQCANGSCEPVDLEPTDAAGACQLIGQPTSGAATGLLWLALLVVRRRRARRAARRRPA